MTENKRFEYIEATEGVDEHIIDCSTEPHFEYYFLKGATEKLNELHEENQKLKQLIKKMGELGGFNKHMIKTICEGLDD